jgi:SusD family
MKHWNKIVLMALLMLGAVGCFKDLDTVPIDPDEITSANYYNDQDSSYYRVLAKLYAGLAVSGQQGPAGRPDISGIDEGFGQYMRGYWYHQELTTDEAVIGWNDQTIKNFHAQTWTAGDGFIYAFYSRIFYQISLVNEFLRETADDRLSARNVPADVKAKIQTYRAEARFLRALSYWHALDLFRKPPFAEESYAPGSPELPKQTDANSLFNYIETELKSIEPNLLVARAPNSYGRATQAAAWMVLAKLYLNAEVYISQNKYQDALQYSERVINAGYALDPTYANLFLADNHNSKEIIFPVNFDGRRTRTFGGMTFIIRAGIGGSMSPPASGVVGGWGGTRTTPQLVAKFPADLTGVKVAFNAGNTVLYPKLYMPGTHQGNDATQTSNSLAATATTGANSKIYEGHRYFEANTEIQFTNIPSNSAPKFGDNGANGSLESNGAKIVIPETGMYYFRVDWTAKTYIMQKRDFSINGTATGGTPVTMNWDNDSQTLVASGNFNAGEFVLQSNTAVYGDTGADALLELNGAPIVLEQSGGHRIAFDLDKPDYTYEIRLTSFDRRGMFYTQGQNLSIADLTVFTEGYAVNKFKNITSTGIPGSDSDFPDTDFPMFRLADAYLMAAEAILRGADGGNKDKAVGYFNMVRTRAYGGTVGNFTANQLTLNDILDERARELYWECHRRTDLIRFGQFTDGTYLWEWKGGVKDGATVGAYRNVFPLPAQDLSTNTNLDQNTGY